MHFPKSQHNKLKMDIQMCSRDSIKLFYLSIFLLLLVCLNLLFLIYKIWLSKLNLSSIITPIHFVNVTCFNADFPRAILIEFVLNLVRWKIMKCDFDSIKIILFSVSHVDIFANSEFRILIVDSMLSPSMKTLVSSENR